MNNWIFVFELLFFECLPLYMDWRTGAHSHTSWLLAERHHRKMCVTEDCIRTGKPFILVFFLMILMHALHTNIDAYHIIYGKTVLYGCIHTQTHGILAQRFGKIPLIMMWHDLFKYTLNKINKVFEKRWKKTHPVIGINSKFNYTPKSNRCHPLGTLNCLHKLRHNGIHFRLGCVTFDLTNGPSCLVEVWMWLIKKTSNVHSESWGYLSHSSHSARIKRSLIKCANVPETTLKKFIACNLLKFTCQSIEVFFHSVGCHLFGIFFYFAASSLLSAMNRSVDPCKHNTIDQMIDSSIQVNPIYLPLMLLLSFVRAFRW